MLDWDGGDVAPRVVAEYLDDETVHDMAPIQSEMPATKTVMAIREDTSWKKSLMAGPLLLQWQHGKRELSYHRQRRLRLPLLKEVA